MPTRRGAEANGLMVSAPEKLDGRSESLRATIMPVTEVALAEIAVVFGDSEAAEAVRAAAVADPGGDSRVVEKRSLDGSVAEWIALATVAGPAVRVVLDSIFRFVELGRVKRFEYK